MHHGDRVRAVADCTPAAGRGGTSSYEQGGREGTAAKARGLRCKDQSLLCITTWGQPRHFAMARCDQWVAVPSNLPMFPERGGWDRGSASNRAEQIL